MSLSSYVDKIVIFLNKLISQHICFWWTSIRVKKVCIPAKWLADGPIAGYSSIRSPARERFIRRVGCHAMLANAT